MPPLISIVIPVYNPGHRLAAAVVSVQHQTVADWECICVDDGSTDASALMLQETIRRDTRFRMIATPNRGASAARNIGMDAACGKYLFFFDADDKLASAVLARSLAAWQPGIQWVDCGLQYIYPTSWIGRQIAYDASLENLYVSRERFADKTLFERFRNRSVFGRLFDRAWLVREGIRFDPALKVGEDALFMMYAYLRAQAFVSLGGAPGYLQTPADGRGSLMDSKFEFFVMAHGYLFQKIQEVAMPEDGLWQDLYRYWSYALACILTRHPHLAGEMEDYLRTAKPFTWQSAFGYRAKLCYALQQRCMNRWIWMGIIAGCNLCYPFKVWLMQGLSWCGSR